MALGYRNSTPTNVIIAESKVTLMKNRVMFLAQNFCTKLMKFGPVNIVHSIEELCKRESFHCYKRPMQITSILTKAWNNVKRYSYVLSEPEDGYTIWGMPYTTLTSTVEVDVEYGKQFSSMERKNLTASELDSYAYGDQDYHLIEGAIEKYNMKSRLLIVYTDGSKLEGSPATGAGIVCDEEDIAYYMNMPKECSTFTAEAFAIKCALEIYYYDLTKIKNTDMITSSYFQIVREYLKL